MRSQSDAPNQSQASLQQARRAPPVGRALRILLGLVLMMVYVMPVYFKVSVRVAMGSLLLVLGLIGVYSLIHIVVSRRIVAFGSCLGAVVAFGLLVTLYIAGASVLPILGHGSARSGYLSWHLAGGCRRVRRSWLRTHGDPRRLLWKAHRAGMSHLLSPGQA